MLRRLALATSALVLASCSSRSSVPPSGIGSLRAAALAPTVTLPAMADPDPSRKVAAFYYPWYGSAPLDNAWVHWNQNAHLPPQDIASDYFPALGPYSSNDPAILSQHMAWLRQAGIGVIIVSWWGKDSPTDHAIPLLLNLANRYGIQVAFHIEPYDSRSATGLVEDVKYLYGRYGSAPAFFHSQAHSSYSSSSEPKGIFFVWCIQSAAGCGQAKVSSDYWQTAMDAIHALPQSTLVIANATDPTWIYNSHFDGLYNYSTLHPDQADYFAWARTLPPGSLYVPSVLPGFSAKRVGYPADTYVDRANGLTYNMQWTAALGTGVLPDMVTITSFNEWHEGTMIEPPAMGQQDGHGYTYADFGLLPPTGYLTLTRQWVDKYAALAAPTTYRARIEVRTTSDWTSINLLRGAHWLRPVLVSFSETATQAGFEAGDRMILKQSLDDSKQGRTVDMVWDVLLTGFTSEDDLSLQVDRGSLGKTDVTVYGYRGNDLLPVAGFTSDITTSGRNTRIFNFAADRMISAQP